MTEFKKYKIRNVKVKTFNFLEKNKKNKKDTYFCLSVSIKIVKKFIRIYETIQTVYVRLI